VLNAKCFEVHKKQQLDVKARSQLAQLRGESIVVDIADEVILVYFDFFVAF
jgi:hypothetical protein